MGAAHRPKTGYQVPRAIQIVRELQDRQYCEDIMRQKQVMKLLYKVNDVYNTAALMQKEYRTRSILLFDLHDEASRAATQIESILDRPQYKFQQRREQILTKRR